MFRIRVFSPPSILDQPRALGELVVGEMRQHFVLDLRYWRAADYERQWRAALTRLLHGAPASALMTAFCADESAPHLMWALWKETRFVYVQPHCVLGAELAERFDPHEPYGHVGTRVPATEENLPIPEWRVGFEELVASVMQIRWPAPFGQ